MIPTDNVFDLTVNNIWLGLPEGVAWHEIRQALMFNRPGREFIPVMWATGPYRLFGGGDSLQSALRLRVTAPTVDWPLGVEPKSVSKLILDNDILYKVEGTPWLLS